MPRPRAEVFAFFADAHNLERITPPTLHFRILTPDPIPMGEGTHIDYQLRLSGVPFRWQTVIEQWEPGVQFTDVQKRGPYKLWRHTHRFVDAPGGTMMSDEVEYALPFGPLGEVAHRLMVARQLDEIFSFRAQAIERLFGGA